MKSYKYETVIKYITDKYIENCNFNLGKLPSEPELAREMKISRCPVNQAYNMLVEQGKLTKISGLGTFIRGHEPENYLFKKSAVYSAGLICETGSLAPQLQAGLLEGLAPKGITLTNILIGPPQEDEKVLARIREYQLSSVFLIPRLYFGSDEHPAVNFARKIAGMGVLPIILERPLRGYDGMQVLVDNAGGSAMATEWMLDEGRDEIAYIGKKDYVVGRERFNGYRNALSNAGVGYDDTLVALDSSNGHFQENWEEFVEFNMSRIMSSHPKCRSFVAFSVEIAFRIYQYLIKNGMFSEDLRIAAYERFMGFDEQFSKSYISLERPLYKIGFEASALAAENKSDGKQSSYRIKRILPEMHIYRKNNIINVL